MPDVDVGAVDDTQTTMARNIGARDSCVVEGINDVIVVDSSVNNSRSCFKLMFNKVIQRTLMAQVGLGLASLAPRGRMDPKILQMCMAMGLGWSLLHCLTPLMTQIFQIVTGD